MRLLLLVWTFNSLSQRLFVELNEAGHAVAVEIDANERLTFAAIERFRPDLLIAPYLRRAIPASVLAKVRCLVVHPGPVGDGGPSALDHAVLDGAATWGVTVLEATADLDAGPVHAARCFPTRAATKASLYRAEVSEGAVAAVFEALERIRGGVPPEAVPAAARMWRPKIEDEARRVDFARDTVDEVLRKVRSADGMPGVIANVAGRDVRLFDAHREDTLTGEPGRILATRDGAVAIAARDGAVWIGHAKALAGQGAERPFKVQAASMLAADLGGVPESAAPPPEMIPRAATLQDIRYRVTGEVGLLSFDFYNGGMTVSQARRLAAAIRAARLDGTRVLVLDGGSEFWSTGMDLMSIEASGRPAETSMATIEAVDDVALAILETTEKVTVAALAGNAGAGGVFLALACDRVWARRGIVTNPHYKNMGNLHGSEYWTYVLPRRLGAEGAAKVMAARLPVGTGEAARLGLVDRVGPSEREAFQAFVATEAQRLAADKALSGLLGAKSRQRVADEAEKPLAAYRAEELALMRKNFFGFDPSYHVARYNFIAKVPQSRTPNHLAMPATGG